MNWLCGGICNKALIIKQQIDLPHLIRREQARRNSEFGTSDGFEFPDKRASVLYLNEWHNQRLRLRVR